MHAVISYLSCGFMIYYITLKWKPDRVFWKTLIDFIAESLNEVRTDMLMGKISSSRCPRNHELELYTCCQSNSIYCSLCVNYLNMNTNYYRCDGCDYDECISCNNIITKKELLIQNPIDTIENEEETSDESSDESSDEDIPVSQ